MEAERRVSAAKFLLFLPVTAGFFRFWAKIRYSQLHADPPIDEKECSANIRTVATMAEGIPPGRIFNRERHQVGQDQAMNGINEEEEGAHA